MLKKLTLILSFIIAINSFSANNVLEEIKTNDLVFVSGKKEARNNIETKFIYNDNSMYTIYCRVNYLTSILLGTDEKIITVSGGDTARWQKSQTTTGSSEGEREVIYIKPFSLNLKTNMIINTTKRMYNINLISSKSLFTPLVRWRYPDVEKLMLKKKREKKTFNLNIKVVENRKKAKYSVSTKKYDFTPIAIFDDGVKTYFAFKNIQEVPTFYVLDGKEEQLVNYRIINNYYIIDRTFEKGVLKLGKKKIIVEKLK